MFLAPLALAVTFLFQVPYRHEKPAFELTLPSNQWRLADQSVGARLNCAFSPTPDAVTRVVVMSFPKELLQNGLATREEQQKSVAGTRYVRIGLEPGKLAGRDVTRWEYSVGNSTIVEWGFDDADAFVIFQLAAPLSVWGNPATRARLESIRDSFRWIGGSVLEVSSARATADEVRAAREAERAEIEPSPYVVRSHRILARIEPTASSIEVTDTLEIEARTDDLQEIRLHTSVVRIEAVNSTRELRHRFEPGEPSDTIVVDLEKPLATGEVLELTVRAKSDGFTRPPAEGAAAPHRTFGQIEPYSSFSSRVLWYPIDRTNDASVEITLDVPAPYVAITGGERISHEVTDGRAISRFVDTHRIHRDLPFGFAITDGSNLSDELDTGLRISIHGFGDKADVAQRAMAIAREVANVMETRFGPTPWRDLRIARVVGERPASIAILPGMILIPAGLFDAIVDADLANGDLSDMNDNAMLVLADAVTRQWTGFGADLSVEWVEGLATFGKALLIEDRYGKEAYGRVLAFCRTTWLTSLGEIPEFAIADPRVTSNRMFLPTVACKTPIVLACLRESLGDEVFFSALRDALFATDPTVDSFDRIESAFTARAGRDLRNFFDAWFYRAGAPRLKVESTIERERVIAKLFQSQADDAYPIDLELELTDESGARSRHPVSLTEKEAVVELAVPNVTSVAIADADRLPARVD